MYKLFSLFCFAALLPMLASAQSATMNKVSTNSPQTAPITAAPVKMPSAAPEQPATPFVYTPNPLDIPMGNPKAAVTVVEYASLSCPHCARFYADVFPELKKQYVDTGKVRFIFRYFPLNGPAVAGSKLVACAPADQREKFLKVLFAMQDKWIEGNYNDALANIAAVGGMSRKDFDACMNNKELERSIIGVTLEAGKNKWVNSTPTFFVNGAKLEGEHDMAAFSKVIDPILAKK
jgi:protein-disulfide isomerase